MLNAIAAVGVHDSESALVAAAADAVAELADVSMAALRASDGSFPMVEVRGAQHPGWHLVAVSDRLGLGGRVLAQQALRVVEDYVTDPVAAWPTFARSDELHGGVCIPVFGPHGIQVLLYASTRARGAPGSVVLDRLERIADAASVGLHHIGARMRERELAVLRERQRLATELHDSVAQMLFAIGVAADRSRQEKDPAIVAGLLEEIEATAAQGRQELRETLAKLNTAPVGLAFEALFEAELRLFERQLGSRVWLTRRGEARELSRPAEELLIDTLREGACNAVKHSAGGLTHVSLSYEAEMVVLSVQTELARTPGRTVAPVAVDPGAGLGLISERAERMHGGLHLAIDCDRVSVLRLELPARASLPMP